jgi:hypothetical protein
MYRVKCAHCGAGNQNVTEKDTCFQCGLILGEAPAPRRSHQLYQVAATVDLSKIAPDQMPPRILPPYIANMTQRSIAIAAAATFLSLAFFIAALMTFSH